MIICSKCSILLLLSPVVLHDEISGVWNSFLKFSIVGCRNLCENIHFQIQVLNVYLPLSLCFKISSNTVYCFSPRGISTSFIVQRKYCSCVMNYIVFCRTFTSFVASFTQVQILQDQQKEQVLR